MVKTDGGSDQIMRDGEALPEPADVATAATNEASVTSAPASPLPWHRVHAEVPIIDADGFGVARVPYPENAKFIVRAVNNHDALLAALKAVKADCYKFNVRTGEKVCGFCFQADDDPHASECPMVTVEAAIRAAEGSK
jgi:hypothetical protein